MALTKRQRELLDLIADFRDEQGYCPSYEEIAHGLQLASLATVHKHIIALESKGYLKRGFNQSRSLELTSKFMQERQRTRPGVPLLGRIAAGSPVEAMEQQGRAAFRRLRRQRQHLCAGGPRRVHDRGPYLRWGFDPARADSGSARRRHRGGAARRQRNHAQAFLSRAGRHDSPPAGQFRAEADHGAGEGRTNSRPSLGGDAKV